MRSRCISTILPVCVFAGSCLQLARPAIAYDQVIQEFKNNAKVKTEISATTGAALVLTTVAFDVKITQETMKFDNEELITGLVIYSIFGRVDPEIGATLKVNNTLNENIFIKVFMDLNTEPFGPAGYRARGFFDATVTDNDANGAALTPTQQFFSDVDPLRPPVNVFLAGHKSTIITQGFVAFGGNSIPGLGDGPWARAITSWIPARSRSPVLPTRSTTT